MDTETFRDKVEKELEVLNREQVAYFAWVCAIRALPYLGKHGHFEFWEKKDKQKHFNTVFYVLDLNIAYSDSIASDAASAVTYAFDIAYAYTVTTFYFAAAHAAAHTIKAAAHAANTILVTNYTSAAAHAAAFSFLAHTNPHAAFSDDYLDTIISKDIETIKSGKEVNIQIDSYGIVWDNFQKLLKEEGCGYWGRLYENIFNNGFEWARKDAEKRVNVPKEIREQGASAVANYLEQLEKKGAKILNEARIIILGEKGAGKTCLARRLVNPKANMTTENESTAGVDTTVWRLEKGNINVHIWDFAGHTVTHAVHQLFLSERCLYIIVYDGRTEERNRLEYWLNHVKNFGGDSKAIILVNRRDQHRVDIPINSLKEQYNIEDLYAFSIQGDRLKLEEFRDIVSDYIENNPSWNNQVIPANYYNVKEELEKLFIKGDSNRCVEHITKDKFYKIAKANGADNIEALLTNLHALGIGLWYKELEEFNTMVLNPEWISNGVYKIVNWVNNEKKHLLTIEEFEMVFKDDKTRYPADKYKFFFQLMEHYELAYKTDRGKCLIIPHLLKEDRPEKLPDFPVGESLMLRYKAEQPLPPNTISRFIVRHNQDIKKVGGKYIVWRYGVVLEDGKGSIALVREEDRTISVSVRGRLKTEFVSTLRETLNDIFNSYKSNKPELQYRVERFGQIPDELETNLPLWESARKIYNHYNKNLPYYDDTSGKIIDMNEVIKKYEINIENAFFDKVDNFSIDKSIQNINNYYNCNIGLQGNLNELAQLLSEKGAGEESSQLKNLSKALKESKNCKNEDEVKESGIANRLKRFVQDLGDEESKLHKTISGVKQGVSIAQDIAKGYNDIAQWLGLPQVPKPFLKKEDRS
ncbi:MAG: 50S ribosome-binding GTPase [Bacteroidales bacterium]|nr:50S ribosome-binding GTPase [Bacteroidales bacterium]